jgi:hypothetical protein
MIMSIGFPGRRDGHAETHGHGLVDKGVTALGL